MKNNSLANRLKNLRTAHNYNQEYVASYLDVVRQTYSNYETGTRIPNTEILFKLAELYRISFDDLIQGTMPSSQLREENPYSASAVNDDLNEYITFMNNPSNLKRLGQLNMSEREMIYYLEKISPKEKEDILLFLKSRASHNKSET